MAPHLLDDVLELAGLLTEDWPTVSARIPGWHPRNEDPPAPAKDPPADPPPAEDPPKDPPDPDPDDDKDPKGEADWKAQARKHERRAKQEAKARADAEAKLKAQDDANKSEQEKAVEAAKAEGKAAADTENQKERRADRLEVAVTRLAAKGVTVKVGEDDKTVKFADPDDVVAYIERAVERDDLDAGELFDADGKVQTEALTTALVELAEAKPHWLAGANGTVRQAGSSDAGRGSGGTGTALADMTPDDHFKQIRKTP